MSNILKTGIALLMFTIFYSCSNDNEINQSLDEDQIAIENRLIELYGSASGLLLPLESDLSRIPMDEGNQLTEDKILLGQMLFHETGLAIDPKLPEGQSTYSCASCHFAEAGFQSGLQQGIADGGIGFGFKGESRVMNPNYHPDSVDVQPIRTPSILNAAYQQVMLWNGQFGANGMNVGTESNWTQGTPKDKNFLGFDGIETQAIAGLGVHRLRIDSLLVDNGPYRTLFDNAFPEVSEEERYSQLNAGLSIAAYERTLLSNEAPFQKMLRNESHTMKEIDFKGAQLFFGKAQCYQCHNGPGMNGMSFHALGMDDLKGNNVIGAVDEATAKGRGGFTNQPEDNFKFKTPTLYNLKDVQFYGHGGSFSTIADVITYKNLAIAQNQNIPEGSLDPAFSPLDLSEDEIDQLTSFIENALYDPNLTRYVPDQTPLGNCFPNADDLSKTDLGCD
jgi:cytochrome c peroxidase